MNLPSNKNQQTMSSREIAELTGKQHKSVMRDVRNMLEQLGEGTDLYLGNYESNGRSYDEYNLPRRETEILVTGYDVSRRAKVIDRWLELEVNNQPMWIQQLSPEAKVAIQDLSNQVTAANAEVDRLQGVCNTITAQFAKGTTAPVFCRQLNGVNVQQVNNKLIKMGMLLKTSRGIEPTSYARDKYFKVQYIDKENDRTGWSGQVSETTLTLTGAKWLYRAYLSSKLPMKKNWDGKFVHMEFN
jgi:phage regulator Rha-like protein